MAKFGVEIRGVRAFAVGVIGSRMGMAAAALIAIAFGSHALTAPERFPPVGTIGLAQLGLAPPAPPRPEVALILPEAIAAYEAEIRGEARAAAGAARPYVEDAVRSFLADNPGLIGVLNAAAAGVGLVLLILAMTLYARRLRG